MILKEIYLLLPSIKLIVRTGINILNFLRVAALVLGLFSISLTSFDYIIKDKIEKDVSLTQSNDDEDSKEEENDDTFYLPEYQATLSTFQIHIDQVTDLEISIPILTTVEKWNHRIFIFFGTSYFKTLFQHIISPNAP